jgi:hypothetical protein
MYRNASFCRSWTTRKTECVQRDTPERPAAVARQRQFRSLARLAKSIQHIVFIEYLNSGTAYAQKWVAVNKRRGKNK